MGALGFATMWEAVFGDVGVALIAILNSMRTMYFFKKQLIFLSFETLIKKNDYVDYKNQNLLYLS